MAIKVNGTVVVDDSRQLTNIASLDATTVAAFGAAGVGGGNFSGTANGAIQDAKPVMVNPNGTLEQITGAETSWSTPFEVYPTGCYYASQGFVSAVYVPTADKILVTYNQRVSSGASNNLQCVAITPNSDGTFTRGTPVSLYNNGVTAANMEYDPNTDTVLFVCTGYTGTTYSTFGKLLSVNSSGVISQGSQVQITGIGSNVSKIVLDPVSNKFVFTVNGNIYAVTPSSNLSFSSSYTSVPSPNAIGDDIALAYDPDAGQFVCAWGEYSYTYARTATLSGNSFTFGTALDVGGSQSYWGTPVKFGLSYNTKDQLMLFSAVGANGPVNHFTLKADGTSLIKGSAISGILGGSTYNTLCPFYHPPSSAHLVGTASWMQQIEVTPDTNGNNVFELRKDNLTVISGTSQVASASTPQIVYKESTEEIFTIMVARRSSDSQYSPVVQKFTPTFSNMFNGVYIGMSDGTYADGETAEVQLISQVADGQTGLTAGGGYYVQLDGTLALTAAESLEVYAGSAVSSTEIVVKG